jgi:CRISPR/Cas system-associated protein Csx1
MGVVKVEDKNLEKDLISLIENLEFGTLLVVISRNIKKFNKYWLSEFWKTYTEILYNMEEMSKEELEEKLNLMKLFVKNMLAKPNYIQ